MYNIPAPTAHWSYVAQTGRSFEIRKKERMTRARKTLASWDTAIIIIQGTLLNLVFFVIMEHVCLELLEKAQFPMLIKKFIYTNMCPLKFFIFRI